VQYENKNRKKQNKKKIIEEFIQLPELPDQ
jgi:hypothetical protein